MALDSNQLTHVENVLRSVMSFTSPADAVVSRYFRENPKLGSHNRAFIAETVFGILRRWLALEYLVPDRATPFRLICAYLMRFTGHQPREFEALLKESDLEWLKSLKAVNLDAAPLAIRSELPQWVIDALGECAEADVLALGRGLGRAAPLDVRVNTLKMKRDELVANFNSGTLEAAATPYSPFGIRLVGKPAINRNPLFEKGAFEVQDEGSQLLGLLLAPRRGEMVADFCAGAGGKTLLLGMQMHSSGRLYAFDVSEKRLANLKPRLARSGLSNVQPQLISSERDPKIKRLAGKMDRVLVDAPCSGLGTLRRNPDLKMRQSPAAVAELNEKQASILASAASLVKPGGRLVYATCSILPSENQLIVEAFLAAHPDFVRKPVGDVLREQRIELEMGEDLVLRPDQHGTDAFYAAVLERKG